MPVQRGRKAAAALAVVARITDHRPPPPDDLTPEQQQLWQRIVDAEPGDQFKTPALQQLLRALVAHATTATTLGHLVDSFQPEWMADPDGLDRFDALLRLRDRETKAVGQIATRLRLTNQSRYMPHTAARASRDVVPGATKPWEPVA